jgi:hypothetical protein
VGDYSRVVDLLRTGGGTLPYLLQCAVYFNTVLCWILQYCAVLCCTLVCVVVFYIRMVVLHLQTTLVSICRLLRWVGDTMCVSEDECRCE